jgi:hypothetical protein
MRELRPGVRRTGTVIIRKLILVATTVVSTVAPIVADGRAAAQGKTFEGSIVGRVLNSTRDEPQRGVRVTLLAGNTDGTGRLRQTALTGRDGRYEFEGLEVSDDRLYVLDAIYKGGLYSGRPLTLPEGTTEPPVIDTTIRVWDPTTDPAAVLVTRDDLFVKNAEGGVGVIEAVTIVNQTDFAYIGRDPIEERDPDEPSSTLGFSIPESAREGGVRIEDASIEIPQLVRRPEFGFALTAAVPPGQTRITFSYLVPGDGGNFDLSRTALYRIGEMSVLARPPLEVESNRLTEDGEARVGGATYTRWTSDGDFDPADPIQVLAIARAGPSTTLVAGLVIGLVAAFALGIAALVRGRRRPARAAGEPRVSEVIDRTALATEIAELDLLYESGDLSADEWESRRKELKRKMAAAGERP